MYVRVVEGIQATLTHSAHGYEVVSCISGTLEQMRGAFEAHRLGPVCMRAGLSVCRNESKGGLSIGNVSLEWCYPDAGLDSVGNSSVAEFCYRRDPLMGKSPLNSLTEHPD